MIASNKNILITIYANFLSNQVIECFFNTWRRGQIASHETSSDVSISYNGDKFQLWLSISCTIWFQMLPPGVVSSSRPVVVSAKSFGRQRAPLDSRRLVVHPTLARAFFAVASRPYRPSNRVSNLVGFLASRRKLRQIGFELLELIKTTFTVIYGRDRPNLTLFFSTRFSTENAVLWHSA